MQHCQENHSAPLEQVPLQVMEGPVLQTGRPSRRLAGDGQRAADLPWTAGTGANASSAGPKPAVRFGRQADGAATAGMTAAAAKNATIVRLTILIVSSAPDRCTKSLHTIRRGMTTARCGSRHSKGGLRRRRASADDVPTRSYPPGGFDVPEGSRDNRRAGKKPQRRLQMADASKTPLADQAKNKIGHSEPRLGGPHAEQQLANAADAIAIQLSLINQKSTCSLKRSSGLRNGPNSGPPVFGTAI
jgi:hypothetical protein